MNKCRGSGSVFTSAFQVAKRIKTGNLAKTVVCPTRLKLSELANFAGILIKFELPNQIALACRQLLSANHVSTAVNN